MKVDQPLRVLHLEDNALDAELVRDLLEAGGVVCDITRVQTREEFVASLQNGFDVILADYSLPSFDGLSALKIAALRSPDVPFIFVSGALGEELAIEALKTGATDYVLKERTSRLVPSVQRALREATERKRAEAEHREHLWFLESLDRIHRAIQGANDLETMIDAVLGEVRDIFQSDRAILSVFGTRSGRLWYRRLAIKLKPGCEHPDKVSVEYVADEDATTMRSEVRGAGRPVALVLGSVPPHVARSHARFGAQSALSMAIEGGHAGLEEDDFYSFTLDECSRRRVWTAEEMRLFEEIGRRLGDALTKLSTLGDLQRRDAYLSEAQRLSQSASWAWNAASNGFVHWSRGRLPLLGPDSGQFPTMEEVRQSIHPDDRDAWSERFARAIRERSRFELEYRSLLPDGGVKHFRTVAHPVLDGSGGLLEFVGTVIDITVEKRAEAEHRSHLWFLESMDRVNRAMQGTQDLQQMLSDVLLATLDVFACDRAWLIYPCDPDAPSWHAVMEHARPQFPGAFALQAELPIDRDVAAAFAAARSASGAVLFGPDYELKIPAVAAERFAVRSQMAMAIDAKADKPYLFGLHQCSRERVWTAEEQRLFQEIGRRLSDAISALSSLRSLRDSERKLDAAQRIAQVGWWERDFGTNRVALSEEVQRIFGVPPVDMPHWLDRWSDLIHPQDRRKTVEAAAAAVRGGPRYDVEYRVVRPDGTVRVVHSQGDVVRDDSGRPLRQFGVLQDITELRQSEDELSEVKERFRVLAESSLTGIYLVEQGRFTYVNPALAKMFGYQVEEIVGLAPMHVVCLDDRPLVAENMRRRLEGEVEEIRYEFRGLRKDGSVFPVEVHGRRIAHEGKIGVLGTLIDNTERKRAEDQLRASEARFRTFVDRATDAFFLLDEQLDVIDVNRQACETLGWSREELIGMHPREFDVGLDEASIARFAQRAVAGEIINFETRHRRKDGATFPVEIRTGTFRQGGKLFYLALARDISERKLAEESLRQSEAYLTEAQRLSHTGSWALDVATNRYVYTSEEFDRLFGFDRQAEAPTREAVLERMHPDDRISWKRILEKSVGEKVDTTSQYRIVLPDGSVRHIHTIRHPVVDSTGNVVKLVGTSIDITERKQAEEELRASESRFRTFVDRATDAFFLMDDQVRVVDVNRQACDSLGWSREELIGIHPREFDVALDEPSIQRLAQRARAGQIVTFETRHRRKDGTIFPVEVRSGTFEQGGKLFYLALARDISERKQAEEELRAREAALRESEQRYRTLFEMANDAIFLENDRDDIIEVNERACTLLGYSRDELLRMKVPELQAPEVRGQAGRVVREEMDRHGDATFESLDLHRSGRRIPVEVTNTGISERGEHLILSAVRDITERKRAEESLRQSEGYLAEAQRLSHTGSWAYDVASDKYVYTSDESDRIYGFDPQGEPPTREAVFERIHPDDRSRCQRNIKKSIREKVDTLDEYRIVLPDGSLRHIRAIRHPLLNDAGEVVRLIGTSIDITERKLAEEALREKDYALQMARTELARVSRLTTLGELTTSIAHEVSQPLGAMVASAGACARWLAADPPAMAEAHSALDNIVADGKRAREVIARIRALTKRQVPQMDLLDLNRKILDMLALTEQELRSHDIVLETMLDRTLPHVTGDRVQLQQVLLNLIVNAIEAMSAVNDRPRELAIVTTQATDGVVVEVRDSGVGFDPERAERVFEAFYTTKAEGIGIGLSISRSIVEAHGGRLWATPNEPHGAVFRFSLPAAEAGQS